MPASVFDFSVLNGKKEPVALSAYRGKVLLVINVATQCGYTKSGYEMTSELYNKYKDHGFEVLAFPCNQFGGQEPGTDEQIQERVCTRIKPPFPLFAKVDVNGSAADPLWDFIKTQKPGLLGTTSIKWNFTSFLINKNGVAVQRFSPGAKVSEVEPVLVQLLQEPGPATEAPVAPAAQ